MESSTAKGAVINNQGEVQAIRVTLSEAIGVSYKAMVRVWYSRLVDVFGSPTTNGDGYKVDVEWYIRTPDGLALIYNFKNGKNYLDEEGLEVEEIRTWNIGGDTDAVIPWIEQALQTPTTKAVVD